jgi:hypothetical protein
VNVAAAAGGGGERRRRKEQLKQRTGDFTQFTEQAIIPENFRTASLF